MHVKHIGVVMRMMFIYSILGFTLFIIMSLFIMSFIIEKGADTFVTKDMINNRVVDMAKKGSGLCSSRSLIFSGIYMKDYDNAVALCMMTSPCRMIELDFNYETK